MMERF